MAGIVSYGAYIPMYRLSRSEIVRAWGVGSKTGEKAIANWDEDTLTMGVEAGIDCLNGLERGNIDGLFFASSTAPYREKQAASIAAAAIDLSTRVITADFANSLRAGASAFRAALDAVNAGSARQVLVVAADSRQPAPATEFESVFGDGAAALLVGNSDVAVTIEDSYSVTNDIVDVWRRDKDAYPRTWEDRPAITYGYDETTKAAIKGLLTKTNLKPSDFSKVAVYGPDGRSHSSLVKALGFDAKTQVQDPLINTMGNTGAALAMMILVSALEEARLGDRILWAAYGDGADAFVLKVTDKIENTREHRGIKRHLASKMMLPTYETYLRYRDLLAWAPEIRPQDEPSLTMIWRERNAIIRGHGVKCRQCGHVQFPPQKICMWCQAQGDFEEVRIADKKGSIFTFSMDERAGMPVLPNILTIVELDDTCRFYGQLTDRDPAKVDVGMRVELTFRKLNEIGGAKNYFWKIRPVRA